MNAPRTATPLPARPSLAYRLFLDHPTSVGESYGEHLRVSWSFGGAMLKGGVACLVHGLLPFLCLRTGSQTVARLYDRMVANRRRHALRFSEPAEAAAFFIAAGI